MSAVGLLNVPNVLAVSVNEGAGSAIVTASPAAGFGAMFKPEDFSMIGGIGCRRRSNLREG